MNILTTNQIEAFKPIAINLFSWFAAISITCVIVIILLRVMLKVSHRYLKYETFEILENITDKACIALLVLFIPITTGGVTILFGYLI